MSRIWRVVRRYGFDLLIVVAAAESALEVAFRDNAGRTPETSHWFAVPAVAAGVLVLLGRRRFPFGAPALFWLGAAAITFIDGRLVVFTYGVELAGFAGALLLGYLRSTEQARIGLVIVFGSAALVAYNDPNHTPGELIFIPILFLIAWLVGFALRGHVVQAEAAEARADQAERERDAAARLAVAEERARIARELHDIVAHAVSVMVLQIGAVRHNLPDEPEGDRTVLQEVERTGRAALAEMRRLLGAMRSERDELELTPQPGLSNLEPLLEEVRHAGLPVELHVDGNSFQLPRAVDLSAYRIVQEGLTNALKHAHAHQADVVVQYRSNELEIEIRDDGRGASPGDGLGHGLVGVRERVKLYGGEMFAGSSNGAGFVLSARLPIAEDAR
jgi:signal transduction histidine kinase